MSRKHCYSRNKNISRNIGAVIFKLGTRRVNHKRNKMTPVVPLEWHLCWLQSLSVKNIISPFSILLSATEGLVQNRHTSHMVLALVIAGSGWYLVKTKAGNFNSNEDRTSGKIDVMATAPQVSFCFFRERLCSSCMSFDDYGQT